MSVQHDTDVEVRQADIPSHETGDRARDLSVGYRYATGVLAQQTAEAPSRRDPQYDPAFPLPVILRGLGDCRGPRLRVDAKVDSHQRRHEDHEHRGGNEDADAERCGKRYEKLGLNGAF